MALLAASLAGTGCFSYVAVPISAVKPQEEVRVLVTNDAGVRLVKQLGLYTTQLDGEFATHGDSVSVTIPIVREYRGQLLDGADQSLYLARSEVVEVRRREFSKRRTAVASALTLAAFVAGVTSIIAIADPNPGDETVLPPPPPAGNRIPLRPIGIIRIPFP